MSGSGFLPAIPPGMAERCDEFERGEQLGETVGRRAERRDTIRYCERKRDNALRIAQRCPEQADHARSIARGLAVAIDDLTAALHEGEGLVTPHPRATSEPYPFTHHRSLAEVATDAAQVAA